MLLFSTKNIGFTFNFVNIKNAKEISRYFFAIFATKYWQA